MSPNTGLLSLVVAALAISTTVDAFQNDPTPTAYTASGLFPTKAYSSYWNDPTAIDTEPEPVITDPLLRITYPESLTDPVNLPIEGDLNETVPIPTPAFALEIYLEGLKQLSTINASSINDTCTKCKMMLEVAKFVSLAAPQYGANVSIAMCNFYELESTEELCIKNYGQHAMGDFLTQVWAAFDPAGMDGQLFCQNQYSACPLPPTPPLNISDWFPPKPSNLPPARKPSGELVKVLHLSDWHIDPRFKIGAEANCSDYLCCRSDMVNTASPNHTLFPAPRYGAFNCDTPQDLALAVLEAIPVLTGTVETGFAYTLFTGDIVPHDENYELSREYVLALEAMTYELFKRELKTGSLYATQGNHDTWNEALDAPHGPLLQWQLGDQFLWNYQHLAGLWELEGWLDPSKAAMATYNYGAYMVPTELPGLWVLSINSDIFYTGNTYNYINAKDPDNYGLFRFVIDALLVAEEAGDKVHLMFHHPPGWDVGQAFFAQTDLLYQIVDRFSYVITAVFFGHTHEDMDVIWYTNNGTVMSSDTAIVNGWDCPSVTPLTNLNSGFRMYEIDTGDFEIYEAYTYYADVNSFAGLDNQTRYGPEFKLEYSTREAYNTFGWPENAPLNATFWHKVTEAMLENITLVEKFQLYQSKSSVMTPPCNTTECQTAKVCYIRSASAPLSAQNCVQGYGSTQG